MKQLLFSLLLTVFFSVNIDAQKGIVTYESTMHLELPKDLPPGIELPKKKVSMFDFNFDNKKSSYVEDLKFEDPNKVKRMMWNGNGKKKDHKIYFDHENGTSLEQVSFFKKEFLVSDTIQKLEWKLIPTEQRDILGYTAIHAILNDTSKVVEAWFTPQIPASVGPDKYYGLPGLILALTMDEKKVILATEVNVEVKKVIIDEPKEGKQMVRKKFEEMKEKKKEEMKKMWGGNKRRFKQR